jgi:hypothetical protein
MGLSKRWESLRRHRHEVPISSFWPENSFELGSGAWREVASVVWAASRRGIDGAMPSNWRRDRVIFMLRGDRRS